MAERLSLRDYQRELVERLRQAGSGHIASKLGIQLGGETWLVDLGDTGEVIPVPPISPVPLTRPWFRGVTNVRGNLYSVVDFPAFLGGAGVTLTDQSRLLLLGEGFRMAAALLVDRSLGLRNPEQLQALEAPEGAPGWLRGQYRDEEGRTWKELDVPELVRHADFLAVAV
jgi:twitching motility protein PilI